ncbi:hypothetical protein [Devosia sp. 2618]|uniref:hypothetical protein n=1 Tax=Devosia sp. 2618 TaxID=3156454 RepID=UPI003393A9E3
MRELTATRSFTYANRRLQAGDYFTARSVGDARALVAIGKARAATADAEVEVAPVAIPDDWRALAWPALKSLAASVSTETIRTKDDAIAAVELEIERRKATA